MPMEYVYRQIAAASKRKFPVLLVGPMGSGKTRLARMLHHASKLTGEFVNVNCACIPEGLAENELFGHSKGAYTGANWVQEGPFERAAGGTVFLDEVGELSDTNQARMLKAVDEGVIQRVGDTKPRRIDCRIIAASWHPEELRPDLYQRLAAIVVRVPSLRDRRQEILPLAHNFLAEFATPNETPAQLTKCAQTLLLQHDWPGNVRELRNVLVGALVKADAEGKNLDSHHIKAAIEDQNPRPAANLTALTPAAPFLASLECPKPKELEILDVPRERWVVAWRLTETQRHFSRADYQEEAGISKATAQRDIAAMTQHGVLQRTFRNRFAWQTPAPHSGDL